MATTTHTEVPSSQGKGVFPPFDPATFPSQLVWLVLTFAILYALMAKVALPRLGGIIDDRQNRISGDIAEAGKLKAESEAAVAAYEAALAEARARAQLIANETRDKQTAEADASRKTLEEQLNVKLAAAEKTIAATKQAAMTEVRGIAADAAKAIVERLTGKAPADAAVASAVDTALKS